MLYDNAMYVDGKTIAADICEKAREKLSHLHRTPTLGVFVLSRDSTTEQFIRIKKKVAENIGVSLVEYTLPETTTTEELVQKIQDAISKNDGIVVQLPLPQHIDFEKIRGVLPASHDVDCLGREAERLLAGGTHAIVPPVVAAFKKILHVHAVTVAGARVVVVGHGRLVGVPAARWFLGEDADVSVCDETTADVGAYTKNADILVLGAGVPHLLKPNMVREGVVILDAGTSESGGKVVGDADPACAEKVLVMTPVPGGVGPVAVAMLFCNLLTLLEHRI